MVFYLIFPIIYLHGSVICNLIHNVQIYLPCINCWQQTPNNGLSTSACPKMANCSFLSINLIFKIRFQDDLSDQRRQSVVSTYANKFEPQLEISNNVVCATSKASDQLAHVRSLITEPLLVFEYFTSSKLLT